MSRITAKQILEASAETGLAIDPEIALDLGRNCGCGIGVMLARAAGRDRAQSLLDAIGTWPEIAANLGVDTEYAEGFFWGFSAVRLSHFFMDEPTRLRGWDDGLEASRELGLDLPKEATP